MMPLFRIGMYLVTLAFFAATVPQLMALHGWRQGASIALTAFSVLGTCVYIAPLLYLRVWERSRWRIWVVFDIAFAVWGVYLIVTGGGLYSLSWFFIVSAVSVVAALIIARRTEHVETSHPLEEGNHHGLHR